MVRFKYIAKAIKKENLINNAHDVGSHLLWCLRSVTGIDNVRGRGLMIAFDLPTTELRDRTASLLQENMMILKCGTNSIRLRPPLTFSITDAEVACLYIKEATENL